MFGKYFDFYLLFNFELLATLVPMAPNSHTYIRMKSECMCQQPMLRKLKKHA